MPRDDLRDLQAENARLRARIRELEQDSDLDSGPRLRALINTTPCLVCFLDGQDRIIEANMAFQEAFGLSVGQCLGKRNQDLAREPGLDAELFSRAHRWDTRAWEEAGPVMCEEIVSSGGRDTIFELIRTPIILDDGRRLGMSIVGQDITGRVKREFDSHILMAEQTAIFENTFVGIAFTRGHAVAKMNATLESMSGYGFEELESAGLDVLFPKPDTFAGLLDEALSALESGNVFVTERDILRKDGTLLAVRLGGKAVLSPNVMRGVVWIVEDINERKRVERLREDTERVVRHDLKSPLNAIIGCADVLGQDVEDPDLRRMADMILNSGFKMLRMIDHSMDLFKMEEGQYTLSPQPVDMVAMFKSLEAEFATLARINDLNIRYLLNGRPLGPDSRLMVMGEDRHLESLFANLVKNALEAAPQGTDVTISMLEDGPTATVEVHNLGELPEDMRHRLFTRYATSGKSKGSGLGTYSARLIARTHGGDVRLANSDDQGTTFSVTLPLDPAGM